MRKPIKKAAIALLVFIVFSNAGRAEVEVVGNKCVLVDGEPFFAIGIYSVDTPHFSMLAEAGFNLVHKYTWEGAATWDGGQSWLDAAHQNGLMGLVGLYRCDVREMDWTRSIARIEKYRDHPALMGWHVMDEPTWDKTKTECFGDPIDSNPGKEYMPAAYDMIKQHDPNHPVTTVTCHFEDPQLFGPYLDVIQADYYPIPPIPAGNFAGTGFRGIKMFVDKSRDANGDSKPFWFVCQAFNWKGLFPTQRELRTMTYTAVASGARGVLYWSFGRLMHDENQSQREMHLEWLKSVTRELRQLYPLLTADTPELIQEQDNVVAMVKSDGQDIYVIAANYERQPTQTRISVPGIEQASAELMFEPGDPVSIENGGFIASFEPVESHIWRIKLKTPLDDNAKKAYEKNVEKAKKE